MVNIFFKKSFLKLIKNLSTENFKREGNLIAHGSTLKTKDRHEFHEFALITKVAQNINKFDAACSQNRLGTQLEAKLRFSKLHLKLTI